MDIAICERVCLGVKWVCMRVYELENNNCSKCVVTKGSDLAVITKEGEKKERNLLAVKTHSP